MRTRMADWRRVVTETFKRWFTHDSMAQSAALSYYTAFSLAPVLLVVVTIAGLVFGKDAVRGTLVRQFDGLMGRDHRVPLRHKAGLRRLNPRAAGRRNPAQLRHPGRRIERDPFGLPHLSGKLESLRYGHG